MNDRAHSARRCEVLSNPDGLIVYDLKRGRLDSEVQPYAFWLLHQAGCKIGSAYSQILNLIGFLDFLDSRGIKLASVSTSRLRQFRSQAIEQVVLRSTSKRDRGTACATVDEKLRNIYRWLLWLQGNSLIPNGTIGPAGRVLCGVSSLDEVIKRRKGRLASLVPLYPLVSKRAGDRYRNKAVVSREEQEQLVSSLIATEQSEYVRRRNALIADIGAEVGFRRDSICSLEVAQFRDVAHAAAEGTLPDTVEIRPARQKRSYRNTFDFPAWLAIEVSAFVVGPRRDLLDRLGIVEYGATSIFLSERTGRPLCPRSVTKIFSSAMRNLGRPAGTSVHALRRLFAREAVEEEIDVRVERGLATDTESVCRAVALRMGHADWKSLVYYVSDIARNVAGSVTRREARRAAEAAQAEAKQLRAEVEELTAALAALSPLSRND